MLDITKTLLSCFWSDKLSFVPSNVIFRNGRTPRAIAGNPDDEEELQQEQQLQAQERERRSRSELQSEVARADVTPEARQRMRELLASRDLASEDLVERFLKKEIPSETAFLREAETLASENASWQQIFETQRSVRRKIQELQHRTESYVELIPRGRSKFEDMLKDVRKINRQDELTDRGLKGSLYRLVAGNPESGIAGVLTEKEANEIYSLDPTQDGFQKKLAAYRERIEAFPDGTNIYRRIKGYKDEERKAEVQFNRLYNQVNSLIAHNVSKLRLRAEKKYLLERASKSIGITLKEGVTIQFSNPDVLPNINGDTVKISRISWSDDIAIYDSTGKAADKIPGTPRIHLTNGGEVMTLGRFKKWVDAAGGVEKINNLDDVLALTGLAAYGIKLSKGMELSYPRRKRDPKTSEMVSTPEYVRTTDIRNGKIYFDKPILFQPWSESHEEYDMRDSLTFGEFVKWWHRYEVERSMGLDELRKMLIQYNANENKFWGREASDNPPILVDEGEELAYPDESGTVYTIKKLDTDGVVLDSGKKTFPEFFYWVKNNNVEKAKKKAETPEEHAAKAKAAHEAIEKEAEETHEKEQKRMLGEAKKKAAEEHKKEREAGTPLNLIKKMWWETRILSFKDLWNMTKEVVEFVKRKHERRSKGRYGEVGSRLPGVLGAEFDRVKQAAENEEVNKYKEAMEHWGIPEIQYTLHTTNSKDVAKACIMTLVHKGEMRWDDHELWATLNRLTSRYTLRGADLYIPDPEHMPFGESGEDLTRYAVDALWGEGTGAEWIGENTSKFNSQKNNFEFKFKQLENDPKQTGGPTGECERMLKAWKEGNYVNPHEYEEMIDAAIKYGKMTAEDKMFFIIAGVIARKANDPHGETLLHIDRIGELNSKYLNNFPMLDFLTRHKVMDYSMYDADKKEYGKTRYPKLEDYIEWANSEFPDDFAACKAGNQFSRFMWEFILLDEAVRTRMSKGVRHAENMDHDDAHIIIPLATPTEIDDLTSNAQGQMKKWTTEGYKNGIVGFSQYFMTLKYAAENAEDKRDIEDRGIKTVALRDAVNSFIRYDLILNNRLLKRDRDNKARLDDRHYERTPVVDSETTVGKHQEQLRNLILNIGRAYGEDLSFLYDDKYKTGSYLDPEERRKQDEYEVKVDSLKERISDLIQSDQGSKAFAVIGSAIEKAKTDKHASDGLNGLPGSNQRPSREELAWIRARARANAAAGHGGH